MLIKQPIGAVGAHYMHQVFEYGNALCKCLSIIPDNEWTNAELFTFVPPELDLATIGDFRHGAIGRAVDYLPAYLLKMLALPGEDRILLFDDVMAAPGDQYLSDSLGVLTVGDEVYHVVSRESATEEALKQLVWATAVSWHFLCVAIQSRGMESILLQNGGLNCAAIGKQWRELILGAFDGEGFIHCVRQSAYA